MCFARYQLIVMMPQYMITFVSRSITKSEGHAIVEAKNKKKAKKRFKKRFGERYKVKDIQKYVEVDLMPEQMSKKDCTKRQSIFEAWY